MAFVNAQIIWFNSTHGFAVAEDFDERIFLHENRRVQPYPTIHGVRFARTISQRHGKRGLDVRVRVFEGSRGLQAIEWMYLDDFKRSKQKSKLMKRRVRPQKRRRNPATYCKAPLE